MTNETAVAENVEPDVTAWTRVVDSVLVIAPDDTPFIRRMILAGRFWLQVERTESHWFWRGAVNAQFDVPYPVFPHAGGKTTLSARAFAWECYHGETSRQRNGRQRQIRNVCGEPLCIRPDDAHNRFPHLPMHVEDRDVPDVRAAAMRLLYVEGRMTLQQIGDTFGLTRERVRQILLKEEGVPNA